MIRILDVSHPYFTRVECDAGIYTVFLAAEFPITSFIVWPSQMNHGYHEVEADVGIGHECGDVDWVNGAGDDPDEAVLGALQKFLNLVISPHDVASQDFVRRQPPAQRRP